MKRPLFNETQRQIMYEDNSHYANRMRLTIAVERFKKELHKLLKPKFDLIDNFVNKLLT
jgi:hypothetical protein